MGRSSCPSALWVNMEPLSLGTRRIYWGEGVSWNDPHPGAERWGISLRIPCLSMMKGCMPIFDYNASALPFLWPARHPFPRRKQNHRAKGPSISLPQSFTCRVQCQVPWAWLALQGWGVSGLFPFHSVHLPHSGAVRIRYVYGTWTVTAAVSETGVMSVRQRASLPVPHCLLAEKVSTPATTGT